VQTYKNLGMNYLNIKDLALNSDVIWLMIPHQDIDNVIEQLCSYLKPKSTIIDAGNSFFKDSIKRAEKLKDYDINFIDCGTSGGLHGADYGFSLTIGGNKDIFLKLEEIFKSIAAPDKIINQKIYKSYIYAGDSGTGHYIKMVHNAIEYAIFEAYSEGFNLLHNGYFKNLDLYEISKTWQNSAIIRSWTLELICQILSKDQDLKNISGYVEETGMARWAIEIAKDFNIDLTVVKDSVKIREESRKSGGNYATKLIALIRNIMGGHKFKKL